MFQVWDWDYEQQREVLLIDADPMRVVNDPRLNEFIEKLYQDSQARTAPNTGGRKEESPGRQFIEFMGVVLIKLFEVLIEIIA